MSMNMQDGMLRALEEAEQEMKRPTKWTVSHEGMSRLMMETDLQYVDLGRSAGVPATFMGLPIETSRGQDASWKLETEC